ncbi:MAG: hypothetical protein GWP19_07980 [Planctomycetia bacterium]|nr:hypothetical protein [Planctomycetia bacterium]
MKSFFCPHCKKEQTKFIQWQTISSAHEFDIKKAEWRFDIDSDGGEHESFNCSECDQKLPQKISEKIWELL